MPQQTVPSLDFDYFALGDILSLIKSGKIYINESYQRGTFGNQNKKLD